jgi:PKD repeat protein
MFTFPENGIYNVCLTVENSEGSDTTCQQIIIDDYTAPDAAFSYNANGEPVIYFFDESSDEITNSPSSWYWDFNDNGTYSTLQNPVHTFSTNGIFNVCLTATNNLGSSTFCNIVIIDNYELPVAGFTTNNYLSPTIAFIDLSSDSIINAPLSWYWDFNDNATTSTQQNPVHTFSQNGIYNVCLIVTNTIGSDTVCHILVIDDYTVPVAGFNYNVSGSPHIQFNDISTGFPTSWNWDFGDGTGSTLHNPSHTFAINGNYNVCLWVNNYLGSDTSCQMVLVDGYPLPVSNFSFNITNDSIVQFTDISSNSPTEWLWNFDDNSTESYEQNPIHIYHSDGLYHVCLTASSVNGTGNPYCHDVQIIINSVEIQYSDKYVFVYPNPFSESAIITIKPFTGDRSPELNVYDVCSNKVDVKFIWKSGRLVIYRGLLVKGIYFFEILNANEKIARGKLIVE